MVASYLFEKAKANFCLKIYNIIYRDDGLVVFEGTKKAREIRNWLEEFQKTVNKAARNQNLQFTAEIWAKEKNSSTPVKEERVQIVTNDEFPFLYMKRAGPLKKTCNLECLGKRDIS